MSSAVDHAEPVPSDRNRPVLALGEALVDFIVSDGANALELASAFVARIGGAPANVTVALRRLGLRSKFVGVVGDDPFGDRIRATLDAEHVDVSGLRVTSDFDTTVAFAWKDAAGDGHFELFRGADAALSGQDVERAELGQASTLVIGSVALAASPSRRSIEHAVEIANTLSIPVCFDVNLRPTLWPTPEAAKMACLPLVARCRLLKLSLDDARGLLQPDVQPEAVVEHFALAPPVGSTVGPRMVVLTDGNRGCWYQGAAGRGVKHMPAFSVNAVEPTGAGDAFTAGLLHRLIQSGFSELDDDDVRYAAAAGALATTRHGALDGLPTETILNQFLAERDAG